MIGESIIIGKNNKKKELQQRAKEMYYNQGHSIEDIAVELSKSKRTIYRWLGLVNQELLSVSHKSKKKSGRPKIYPLEIINRIIELKKELPQRSAPLVHKWLKEEFPDACPSIPYIQKIVRDQGLSNNTTDRSKGYRRFQRSKPNDMWQIDIAGVQTVGYLKQVYLIALLDDCSRYIVSARYFKDQTAPNVIMIVRDAILAYGRPNEILADNGAQFKNILGELATKYSKLLKSLGIKPIFASPYHPQTKGKLERWFKTVNQMFLIEARFFIKNNPESTLADLNRMLEEWVKWYNNEKSHRSLPNKCRPAKIFFETEDRIFRPLQANVNWNRWLHELTQRKVNKYNEIHYKSQLFSVPPGYSGSKVDVIEYEDKIEIYFKENVIITHPYGVRINPEKIVKSKRKIRKNGTIAYNGKTYSIDYKLANKTVEVQEADDGRKLLVYLNDKLIKTLNL
ncbi:MAG: DDE-type integrase/transposase/recombinase [Candidatus Atribacteria bacterium]|nr:DDE-type integrase/transposase/recombinase [Candidatus Atribacteria bacterium]